MGEDYGSLAAGRDDFDRIDLDSRVLRNSLEAANLFAIGQLIG